MVFPSALEEVRMSPGRRVAFQRQRDGEAGIQGISEAHARMDSNAARKIHAVDFAESPMRPPVQTRIKDLSQERTSLRNFRPPRRRAMSM